MVEKKVKVNRMTLKAIKERMRKMENEKSDGGYQVNSQHYKHLFNRYKLLGDR